MSLYFDSHVHFPHPSYLSDFIGIMDRFGVGRINAVCVPHPTRLSVVPDALYLKAHHPERVYVSGGMDFSYFLTGRDHIGSIFADYVDTLMAMGCDGIKMWEGKPDIRKRYAIPPFDSPIYAPYWNRLKERKIPLVFHVNDPETYWDKATASEYVIQQGWFYGDGTFINNEVQYSEVFNVLSQNPELIVIFAHFNFFSAQLPRLAEWFERFPNMNVDLAPGSEMYINFSKRPEESHDFFCRFQDRILYGTDYGAGAMLEDLRYDAASNIPRPIIYPGETRNIFSLVRRFLESGGEYRLQDEREQPFWNLPYPLRGISLPSDVLAKIYQKNFERLVGPEPHAVHPAAIVTECEGLIQRINTPGSLPPGGKGDDSVAKMVKTFFESQIHT